MKNILYLSTIALLAVATTACNDNKRAKNFNEKTLVDDKANGFIKEANNAGMAEIKAGTLAQSKSSNPRVINFAKMMVTDHNKSGNELKQIADEKYVNRKPGDDTLTVEHSQMINSLNTLSGPAFDKAYMNMMVADHGKVLEMYRSITRNRNSTIRDFAEKTIPVLQKHLDSAKAINTSLK
jgi:putative membrane protein